MGRTYPSSSVLPPANAQQRFATGRMLMVFFGLGFVWRAGYTFNDSRWLKSPRALDLVHEVAFDGPEAEREMVTPSEPPVVWAQGGPVAAVLVGCGLMAFGLGFWCSRLLRTMKHALQYTKSLKKRR